MNGSYGFEESEGNQERKRELPRSPPTGKIRKNFTTCHAGVRVGAE